MAINTFNILPYEKSKIYFNIAFEYSKLRLLRLIVQLHCILLLNTIAINLKYTFYEYIGT